MKTPCIALLLVLTYLAGAEIAVKFYSEEPTSHPNRVLGIPTNAVSHVIFNTNSAPPGYVLMSLEQYRDHQVAVRPAHRAWLTNVKEPWDLTNSQPPASVVSNRLVNIQALKVLVDTMQDAETNWASLTAGQIQGLVRVHNQALLRLRPLLRDLYQDHLAKE